MFTSTITAIAQLEKPSLEAAAIGSKILVKEQGTLDITEQGYGKLLDLHGNEFIIPNYTIKEIYNVIPENALSVMYSNLWPILFKILHLLPWRSSVSHSPDLLVPNHV